MSGLIGELIEGIVDFVTDVWVARRLRANRGRPERSLGDDAAKVAVLICRCWDWACSPWSAVR
ncbi:hypothetical protein [Stenotrophomonas oahuensis]|uniref:Uncharacterized protein n=1 Tax=Stenotrophomonas oahuensis TaxID=3003271 RepID=A0ABY9YQ98_9GAMM|nr:hypothetical protein [Stenotrophomonas sp. A5586]WNH52785.1 hypothetical protein PDM29_00505 [Stenotrophomonas sp. A5586]